MQVFILWALLAAINANEPCSTGSCDALPSDEVSLIQGLLEPDLVVRNVKSQYAGARGRDITAPQTDVTTTTTTQPYAVKGNKVKFNAAGDFTAFLSGIRFDLILFFGFIAVFLVLQFWYPLVYAFRLRGEDDEFNIGGYFSWVVKALSTPIFIPLQNSEEPLTTSIEETSGLDAAYLIEFTNLAMKFMMVIGLPAVIAGIPCYAYLGGGMAQDDHLSWLGIGNVVYNNTFLTGEPLKPDLAAKLDAVQFIFWVVALMVWAVVVGVQRSLHLKQHEFIQRRHKWLLRMEKTRATTILVQGIPEHVNCDSKLKQFFESQFGPVRNAFIVKDVSRMRKQIATYQSSFTAMKKLESTFDQGGRSDIALSDEISAQKGILNDIEMEILEGQRALKHLEAQLQRTQEGGDEEGYYTTNGFVTFEHRQDAERALGVRLSNNDDMWILETPPAPSDVRYQDFEWDDTKVHSMQLTGYAAVGGLFFAFTPIVVGISNVSLAIASTPFIANMLEATGMKSTCDGVLQTIGLTIMMSMLPTFLVWIFQMFFTLKADRWCQVQIQEYYFWFLVLFVLLVTSVGQHLSATLSTLSQAPFKVFSLFAEMMPVTTHFYLNYVFMQPVTHSMNLTRYMNLIKFLALRKVCNTEERAKVLAEPEDQDYYGMGSRSARFTLMLLIGLVFGTICPLIHVVVFWNFAVCRIIYGYLIQYAENPKSDMGGVHWCMQLDHLQIGLLIYLIMMTGILLERAESKGPGILSAVSFLWWFIQYRRYKVKFRWEKLPYIAVVEEEKISLESGKVAGKKTSSTWDKEHSYKQKELEWTAARVEEEWEEEIESNLVWK